ncbi:unnamed protein product [Caenorhabditis bovis]|uniref:Uncharacterized protein n=1 Tax=Caenorhabditis bovis TaxID=2654633 RepID=A0A8S1ECQ9_9PELO|nr:unnamed protein product [Caenorhabditis bovis]
MNPFARHGLRTKGNVTVNADIRAKPHKNEFIYHEFDVNAELVSDEPLKMRIRTEYNMRTSAHLLVFEPFVLTPPSSQCDFASISDVCECVGSS